MSEKDLEFIREHNKSECESASVEDWASWCEGEEGWGPCQDED